MKKYVDKDRLQEFATKLHEKQKTIFALKAFITPEDYGAKGDGITNDSYAIQSAIDTGKPVYMANKYLIEESLTISNSTTIRCDGEINYVGTSSAIVVTTQFVNLYIKELKTNGNGIEMRPVYQNPSTSCQMDIIECDRILCQGSNGIGLYLNSENGITQFCKFIINRLQGGNSIGTNIGIKIVGTARANKYCNACIFDIHSLCFFATGILTDTVDSSCIENRFNNINFEQNTVAINMANADFEMNCDLSEPTAGSVKITNGNKCDIHTVRSLAETKIDLSNLTDGLLTSTHINIYGNIINNNGIYLTNNLMITECGAFSFGATTPFVSTNLSNVIGSQIVKYVYDGDEIDLPAIRKGNSSGYVLHSYTLYIFGANSGSGTITLKFSDGTTRAINFTSWTGIITVLPAPNNTGQSVLYQAL